VAWKRGAENSAALPDGLKPGSIAKVELYGSGERQGVSIRRRLMSFELIAKEIHEQRINEKGEDVTITKRRIGLTGGAGFADGRVVFPSLEGWPHETWTEVIVVATDADGEEAELAKLAVE
jgi:hypothetical protein